MYFDSWPNGKRMKLSREVTIVISFTLENNIYSSSQVKNNHESGDFCCLHICLFNNGKAIHFRTTLTPLRLLFLLLLYKTKQTDCRWVSSHADRI